MAIIDILKSSVFRKNTQKRIFLKYKDWSKKTKELQKKREFYKTESIEDWLKRKVMLK